MPPQQRLMELVTILILIDGFLQYKEFKGLMSCKSGHNPYFNRWFSAIMESYFWVQTQKQSQSLF